MAITRSHIQTKLPMWFSEMGSQLCITVITNIKYPPLIVSLWYIHSHLNNWLDLNIMLLSEVHNKKGQKGERSIKLPHDKY